MDGQLIYRFEKEVNSIVATSDMKVYICVGIVAEDDIFVDIKGAQHALTKYGTVAAAFNCLYFI